MGEMLICEAPRCGRSFERRSPAGKLPRFCSPACRQRASYVSKDPAQYVPRATQADMVERLDDLFEICQDHEPLTVRNGYYLAVTQHLVPKDNSGYGMVQRAILELRRTGLREGTIFVDDDDDPLVGEKMPFAWIVDNTRWMRKPKTYDSAEGALANTARTYRRELWNASPFYVEVWVESDSIAGLAGQITSPWDVPLMPTKGFTSETFAFNAADTFKDVAEDDGKVVIVIYIGDLDPAGLKAEEQLKKLLAQYSELDVVDWSPDVVEKPDRCHDKIVWKRLFVTPDQRRDLNLDRLGTDAKGTKQFPWIGGKAVEAEAIDPNLFRTMLDDEVQQYVDERRLEILLLVEEEEKAIMQRMKLRPTKKLTQLREKLAGHDYLVKVGVDLDNPEGYTHGS